MSGAASPACRPQIGIIGLGNMGWALANRLRNQDYRVSGWSRRGLGSAEASRWGIIAETDIAALCSNSDIILLSLFDDASVVAVIAMLCECDLRDKLIVDTSTISPDTSRSIHKDIASAGGSALDAPISGGPEMVESGTAGTFIGGDKVDADRFLPIAESYCTRIHHMGPAGAGSTAKTVNNMIIVGYWQCVKEALQLGKRFGLPLEIIMEILKASPAANGALVSRIPVILGQSSDVGFTVAAAVKDASLFAATASQHGVATPALNAALASFVAHRDGGNSEADVGSVLSAAYADQTR